MNPEFEAILRAMMESRQILEAKMDAFNTKLDGTNATLLTVETKLDALAADVTTIKERIADMKARDEFLTHKTSELEAELFVIKRREKA